MKTVQWILYNPMMPREWSEAQETVARLMSEITWQCVVCPPRLYSYYILYKTYFISRTSSSNEVPTLKVVGLVAWLLLCSMWHCWSVWVINPYCVVLSYFLVWWSSTITTTTYSWDLCVKSFCKIQHVAFNTKKVLTVTLYPALREAQMLSK